MQEGPVNASALLQTGRPCANINMAKPFKQTLQGGWAERSENGTGQRVGHRVLARGYKLHLANKTLCD